MTDDVKAGGVPAWFIWSLIGLAAAALLCLLLAMAMGDRAREEAARKKETQAAKEVRTAPMVATEVPPPAEVSAVAVTDAISISEAVPAPFAPRWQVNAAPEVSVTKGTPVIAIVLDDMGVEAELSARAVNELPAAVTFAFLPYGGQTLPLAREAKTGGHEIMVHIPMEPLPHGGVEPDMGPDGLRVGMSGDEIDALVTRNIEGLKELAVGANNHMGSRFTAWEGGMRVVLSVLQREGMLFLDSKTSAPTQVGKAAEGLDLPVLSRDIFLDHIGSAEEVRLELVKAEALAKKRGYAVVIGHPLPATLDVLNAELPRLVSAGIVLVPLTQVLER